jgi:hypothetical protein
MACGDASPAPPLARATIDTLPSGAVVVTNQGPTRWSGTEGWRLISDGEIAPAAGTPGEIGDPIGVALGDDGRVYLVQQQPTTIKVYGPTGAFERDISREGEGPGEFRIGYIAVRGDTVALQDPALYRFTTFLADGTLLGSTATPGDWATSYLDRDADGVVAVPGSAIGPTDDHQAVMVRTRMNGTAIDTILLPDRPAITTWWRASWTARGRHWNMRIPAPLQPALQMRYHADGLLVYGTTDQPTLIFSRTGRDTVRVVHTTVPTIPITQAVGDSLFESQLAGMEWQAEWLVAGGRDDVPTHWPPWTALTVDDSGRTWLGIPDSTGGTGTAQLFGPDGVLLGAVAVPDPAIFTGSWHNNRVAIITTGVDGAPVILFYRLVASHPS